MIASISKSQIRKIWRHVDGIQSKEANIAENRNVVNTTNMAATSKRRIETTFNLAACVVFFLACLLASFLASSLPSLPTSFLASFLYSLLASFILMIIIHQHKVIYDGQTRRFNYGKWGNRRHYHQVISQHSECHGMPPSYPSYLQSQCFNQSSPSCLDFRMSPQPITSAS